LLKELRINYSVQTDDTILITVHVDLVLHPEMTIFSLVFYFSYRLRKLHYRRTTISVPNLPEKFQNGKVAKPPYSSTAQCLGVVVSMTR